MRKLSKKKSRAKVKVRIRKKISGTKDRPRLAVHFSNNNIYAQVIDDTEGLTLASASTLDKKISSKGANISNAQNVGKVISDKIKDLSLNEIVFDRGGHRFHGKVKALADTVRDQGINF